MRRMEKVGIGVVTTLVLAVPGVAQSPERVLRELEARQAWVAAHDVARSQDRLLRELGARQAWMAGHDVARTRARLVEVQAGLARVHAELSIADRARVPEPWLEQDPADSLYRVAREDMNARRYQEAAGRFTELRERYPRSGYVGDSYYFQALALYRWGGSVRHQQALELLDQLAARYPDASTADEANALRVRIQSSLARRGNADAAAAVTQRAAAQCEDEDQDVRATALSALLQMDAERAVPILREVLRQRDECTVELRKQAVFMLSRKSDDQATYDLLVDLAVTNPDPEPEVRNAAIFWLAQSDRPEALDALLDLLEQPGLDDQTREQAVFAIARHDSPRAFQVLRDFARNPSAPAEVRSNAIFWLGQRGGADAVPFLRELWGSIDDPELKDRVLFAMARSGGAGSTQWLLERVNDPNEPIQVRKQALFWAGQQGGLTVQQALEVYRSSEDRELKEQAIFVLSRDRDNRPAAVDAMIEIARVEEDKDLRRTAIFWLGRTDDPRVADFLLEVVRGGGG